LAFVIAGVIWASRRGPATPDAQMTELTAPRTPDRAKASPPSALFTDITTEAGIRFTHCNGAEGDKLLPETMGGGAAFFDYDNDNDPDLFFVNGMPWTSTPRVGEPAPTMALYRNKGHGQFEDVTEQSGLDVSAYGMGAAVGDYDNDGWVDLYITAVGKNHLLRNQGNGSFETTTEIAGVAGAEDHWSTCAAWFDFDNDGDLDLFVGGYVRWSREIDFEVGYSLVGVGRAYGPPNSFEGTFPCLYRNEGDGQFTDVSAGSGVMTRNPATGVPVAKMLGVAPVDIEGDGAMDLVAANDTVQNFLFSNQRDGSFEEIGAPAGVAFDSYGNARGAMGIDTAWFRNDERLGIAIGNFANEMTALYVSQNQPLTFADEAIPEGIGPASRQWLKFGIFFFDYDLDGWLDLLSVNGHLEEEIQVVQRSQTYAQPAQLFWNAGGTGLDKFVEVTSAEAGMDLFQPLVGRGSAYADIDGDGDLDVVMTQVDGAPLLLRNDQDLGRCWLRVKLIGVGANRDALGARIELRAGGIVQTRQVMPTRGYLSQSESTVTFGLGPATQVEELHVTWPGGARQAVPVPGVNRLLTVRQERAAGLRNPVAASGVLW
jgi:hypothetical protein